MTLVKVASPGLYLLEDAERDRLRSLVEKHGLAEVVRRLGVSRGAVSSAVGGIGVRRGSVEMIVAALSRCEEESNK